jgi:hypothetical protein
MADTEASHDDVSHVFGILIHSSPSRNMAWCSGAGGEEKGISDSDVGEMNVDFSGINSFASEIFDQFLRAHT